MSLYRRFFGILILSIAFAPWSARADHPNAGPLLGPGDNSYQVLKHAFESAGAAQISDFPWLGDLTSATPTMKCVGSSDPGAQMSCGGQSACDLAPMLIGRLKLILGATPGTPAVPGNGPLFPGTPAVPGNPGTPVTVIPFLINGTFGAGYTDAQWTQEFTTGQGKGTTVTMSTTASGDLQGVSVLGTVTTTDTFRKTGALLFTHELVSQTNVPPSGTAPSDGYFYCYPTTGN